MQNQLTEIYETTLGYQIPELALCINDHHVDVLTL